MKLFEYGWKLVSGYGFKILHPNMLDDTLLDQKVRAVHVLYNGRGVCYIENTVHDGCMMYFYGERCEEKVVSAFPCLRKYLYENK